MTDEKELEQLLTKLMYGKTNSYCEDGTPLYFDKDGNMYKNINEEIQAYIKALKN